MSDTTPAVKTGEPVVPAPPRPIADFNNSGLRESVQKALEGVEAGHGHAILNIDNHGAGLMLVERVNEHWALVVATRYSFRDGGSAQAAVQVSW
jgi:hypothetical protein